VSQGRFRRRFRFLLSRVRRPGRLKLAASFLILAVALAFHLTIAIGLANDEAGDSKVYMQIAANVVDHGVYSNDPREPYLPTLIRTPGYPLFLAAVFDIGGVGSETAVRIVQVFLFWLACIITGMIAGEWVDPGRRSKALLISFILAAFCPFIVIYTATILSEVPTMFLLAATLLAATYAFKSRKARRSFVWWGIAGVTAGLNVLVRPDAGLFAFGIGLTVVFTVFFGRETLRRRFVDRFVKGLVFSIAFVLPLIPWTIRNEAVFGVFQPLSPQHAEMPGEFVPQGYYRWVRTWIDDEAYIDPMLWRLEIQPLRVEDVPEYAFTSQDEKREVAELFDEYNNSDPEHPAVPKKNADSVNSEDQTEDQASSGDDDEDSADNSEEDNGDQGDEEDESDTDQQDTTSTPEELDLKISPDVDTKFAEIANDRIARDPWCYYICLPTKRSASMWFDTHSDWYPFNGELFPLEDLDHNLNQHIWLPIFGGLNLIYTLLSFAGLWALWKMQNGGSHLWLFLVLAVSLPRIIFFGTMENPEPRYLVELFILAAILGGVFLAFYKGTRSKG
jgi:dolichyl-phosphate-mannose-protein mannosyltransferase